ncbi:hypothetical protein [Terrabacter sp. 2RAF25]|uniref:hypothetical protein n=1 Tax=Terrabacter sp. 2RAF25 TaxID=3232998 RepID=UPI003F9E2D61
MRADHYDSVARSYARQNESGLFNAHYNQPALVRLAGDVRGVGCSTPAAGPGP